MGFRVRRNNEEVFFSSWKEYLGRRGDQADQTLCRVLANVNEELRTEALNPLTERRKILRQQEQHGLPVEAKLADLERKTEEAKIRGGFPWVTLMLGSGCLSITDGDSALDIAHVPGLVAEAVRDRRDLPGGQSVADAVRRFAEALVQARVPETDGSMVTPPAIAPVVDHELSALVLLCAYLTTRLHFEVGAANETPLVPASEPLSLDPRQPANAEIVDAVVRPLRQALSELRTLTGGVAGLGFVSDFVELVRQDLEGGLAKTSRIRYSDVALMSELAWHFMTQGTAQYAGWSELLLLLSLKFEVADRRVHWPFITDLGGARDWLKHGLRSTTLLSWASRVVTPAGAALDGRSGSASQRDKLYDAAADLLIEQAGLNQDVNHRDAYPPAVGYVVSFDLELEMALLAKESPFVLVVPFQVSQDTGDTSRATFVWLQTLIDPRQASKSQMLDEVFTPRDWHLISRRSADISSVRLDGLPVVVRLAGAPLVAGPSRDSYGPGTQLGDELAGRLNVEAADLTLQSTVLLDENTALHQWAADLTSWSATDGNPDDLGLPEPFLRGRQRTDARFWVLLGIQLGDVAVRQRAASIVGAQALREGISGSAERTARRAGVVVNRRSTPRERDVFHWQGLDAVAARYGDVVADLEHYVEHLRQPKKRRVPTTACEIPEERS